MSDDAHTPTTAAPTPPVGPTVQPTPVVTPAAATLTHPAGSAAPAFPGAGSTSGWSSAPLPSERPEVIVGAAFAGGIVAAMILKRLGH